jgi:hypothetical protein
MYVKRKKNFLLVDKYLAAYSTSVEKVNSPEKEKARERTARHVCRLARKKKCRCL